MKRIIRATGCPVSQEDLLKEDRILNVQTFGCMPGGDPVMNTNAINQAINAVHMSGGGTVYFPQGEYKAYTIRLMSDVNLKIPYGCVIRAARSELRTPFARLSGEGGNYDEPEVNLYGGIQSNGHSAFANAQIYGADIKNVMIYGGGRFDGSCIDPITKNRVYTLQSMDPSVNPDRTKPSHDGTWFGNKCIGLVRSSNIVIQGIEILLGGHFGINAVGCDNLLVENTVIDTNRDAFNIDCCQNVTVRHSRFNSLTDDAIVLKASFGAGMFRPCKNILVHDCTVSGYDAGSVIAGTFTSDKLAATDRCGPTARCKLGTEGTCGFDTVLFRNITFKRSRGFALEAVDCSDISNVIFTDCIMDDISSSPIFIRVGDRARFPVTGNSPENLYKCGDNNVRYDNREWVLPNNALFGKFPPVRYVPSYRRDISINTDGTDEFSLINPKTPVNINHGNVSLIDGKYYLNRFDPHSGAYLPDMKEEIKEDDLPKYANAVGGRIARIYNVEIANIKVTNADPRYPVILAGLVDSKIENVTIRDIDITYRGGLLMRDAVEQRRINTSWMYTQFETSPCVQSLPWMVNTFFAKNETLLPRVKFENDAWVNDPYNVPEAANDYPEPSMFGILPASGVYMRHVNAVKMENIKIRHLVPDERPIFVLDDVREAEFSKIDAQSHIGSQKFVGVKNEYKRRTNFEYIKNEPYFTTDVCDITLPEGETLHRVCVNSPAPGTPPDDLFKLPTVALASNGFAYETPAKNHPLPLTVHRPFIKQITDIRKSVGEEIAFKVEIRDPASEFAEVPLDTPRFMKHFSAWTDTDVSPYKDRIRLYAEKLPEGASFDEESHEFTFTAEKIVEYEVIFVLDDGVLEEKKVVRITVTDKKEENLC
ncbi:MAG: right-handed parallel beta-helix repeat-containing protein [Clostridia bacterium]|nr:right-handed parallel beta-helix repeat-containing protein [Clostridia bacterium]